MHIGTMLIVHALIWLTVWKWEQWVITSSQLTMYPFCNYVCICVVGGWLPLTGSNTIYMYDKYVCTYVHVATLAAYVCVLCMCNSIVMASYAPLCNYVWFCVVGWWHTCTLTGSNTVYDKIICVYITYCSCTGCICVYVYIFHCHS